MKSLTCSVIPATNQLAKILKGLLQDFGHKISLDHADYIFICNDPLSVAAAVDLPSKLVYLDNQDDQLSIYYLAGEQKVYLISQHSIDDEDGLTESLEDLIIQLARVELEEILDDCMLRGDLELFATAGNKSKPVANDADKILEFSRGSYLAVPDENLVQIFLKQVQQNPAHPAVICEDIIYSYQELDNYSSRLAHQILAIYQNKHGQELPAGTPIAFYFERKAEVMLTILAILKLRCAYVPIDIKISANRLHFILDDTKAPLLITGNNAVEQLISSDLNIDVLVCDSAVKLPPEILDFDPQFTAHTPAYVLYTSGSTGQPKGCIITHANLVNLFYSTQKLYGFSSRENMAQYCAFAFDVFCLDWSAAILSGGTFHIIPENVKQDSKILINFLNEHKITFTILPTAVFHVLDQEDFAKLTHMKNMLIGGEKLRFVNADKIGFNLYNGYGPTEATVECILYKVIDIKQKDIPIGRPIDNVQAYVLDDEQNLVAEDVIGELYISGAGVGVGYLNNDKLTQERFLENKFATARDIEKGYTRLYKTGDLVKWLPDGNLEYIGRNDFQVKFRGFRMELGDIEATMLGHPDVKQSVVLLDKKVGDGALVGYYVSTNNADITDIKKYLTKKLPEYMMPAFFIRLDSIPLTLNGKVDRNKLLELNIASDAEEYSAPIGEIEVYLAEVWKKFLKLERISRNSSFFALGGHSILLMRLLSEIRNKYSCNLVPRDVFTNPRLCDLASIVANNKLATKQISIAKTNLSKAKASLVQKNYWMIDQMENSASTAFTTPVFFNIHKNIDAGLLSRAVKHLVQRHQILRSKFSIEGDEIYQIVTQDTIDLITAEGSEEVLNKWLTEQNNIVFKLSQGQLFRPALFKVSDKDYSVLSLTHHHAIGDGYSIDILLRDLLMLYSIEKGEVATLAEIEYSYIDFTTWHEKWIVNSELYTKHMEYWKAHLPSNPDFTLPSDKIRPANLTNDGAVLSFELSEELTQKINHYAKEQKITEFALLLSAFYVLLAKYSGENRVNVGIPFANRHYDGVENIVGCFINTLPFEYEINHNLNTLDMIRDISNELSDLQSYQDVYYPEIIEHLKVKFNFSYAPLYQVMFVSELFEENNPALLEGVTRNNYAYNTAKLDFSCYFLIIDGKLVFNFEYNTNLFVAKTMSDLAGYFKNILQQITDNVQVREISLVGDSTEVLALSRGNDTLVADKTLLELFKQQVELNPGNTALVCDDIAYSYWELDRYSTRLAEFILNKYFAGDSLKLEAGTPIAFYFERTPEVIHVILAILKLGCAYVPIDSKTTPERLNYILSDTRAPLLITNISKTLNVGAAAQVMVIDDIENIDFDIRAKNLSVLPSNTGTSDTTAYILYTSGTTGKPKGCAVTHANLVNLLYYSQKTYSISGEDKIAQYCSFAFDTFCSDWSTALLSGAALYIVPEDVRKDTKLLVNYLNQNQITFIDIPTAVFHVFDYDDLSNISTIKNMKIGGEKLRYINTDKLTFNLFNAYGPTETTVESILYQVIDSAQSNIPIGRPLDNVQAYVLDNDLNLVPSGISGELYIGGAGVARGYFNNPELTHKQFITNKFATEIDRSKGYTRLYKTGDLVKWSENGNLEYIGRNDFQVKLRGYRIELGEIEATIQSHAEVKQSVVLLDKNIGDGALVAYYTGESDSTHLKDYLAKKLPEYMVPSFLIKIDTIPLTLNGKVDRNKLLELNSYLANATEEFNPPLGEIEEGLANIWKKLLKLEQISRDKGFFELGGHSVLLMRLLSEIRNKYSCNLVPKDVFTNPKLCDLAKLLEKNIAVPQTSSIARTGLSKAPASTIQQGLFLIHYYDKTAAMAYTTPLFLEISGDLIQARLSAAISELSQRHEMLRSKYLLEDETLYQIITDEEISLEIETGTADEVECWLAKQSNIIFSMEKGKLFRPRLFKVQGESRCILSLTHHHIIADGYSLDILIRELFNLYQHGKDTKLPEIKYSYIDFCAYQEQRAKASPEYAKSVEYWKIHLPSNPNFTLSSDKLRPGSLSYNGEMRSFELTEETSQKIKLFAKENNVSEFAVLLSGFYILLAKYTGDKIVNVGIPFANRNHPGVENIIGCFINTLPFEYEIDSSINTLELIQDISNKISEMQSFQDIDLLTLMMDNNFKISEGYNSLYQILFVMQERLSIDNIPGLSIKSRDVFNASSKYDFSFQVQGYGRNVLINVEYNTNIFTCHSINKIFEYYHTILQSLLSGNKLVRNIKLISANTENKILTEWSRNYLPEVKTNTVISLFEQQVITKFDETAIICADQKITYRQLNNKANQLAAYLLAKKHQPGFVAAILLPRSIELVIAVLGVLKAGGTYLPLSHQLPSNRVKFILEDASVASLIYSKSFTDNLGFFADEMIDLDKFNYELYSLHNSKLNISGDDLAYIIYTSGSTGNPKGVLIQHKALSNTIIASNKVYQIGTELSKTTSFASFIFDVFVSELFLSLVFGGELHILSDEVRADVSLLSQYFIQNKIQAAFLPPAILEVLPHTPMPDLIKLIFAGEACSKQAGDAWAPKGELYNFYGPTETTIYATCTRVVDNINCIGRPLDNVTAYVLDNEMNIVPEGVVGELYIGGAGVAKGYLNNEELTNERFVVNKFATPDEIRRGYTRLYKTGDLVKWLPDGNIEYIGRNDFQVKLRGYRIELGEIEKVIDEHPNIERSIAFVDKRIGNGAIVGYYVSANEVDGLKEYIANKLPEYMVPPFLFRVDDIPLTLNGKVDRNKLEEKSLHIFTNYSHKIAPNNSTQFAILNLFENILGFQSQISIDSNFFDLGGNSIQAAKIVGALNKTFNKKFMVSFVYRCPTIESIAQNLDLSYSPLLNLNSPLNTGNNNSKLYMFHTARGSAEVYFNFANMFDNLPVVGIESYNLYNEELITDFKQLAKFYCDNIIQSDPELSMYHLSGWSFGGLLAYEVAHQLKQNHAKECQVILFDTLSVEMFAKFKQAEASHTYNIDKNYGVSDQYLVKSKLMGQLSEEMYLSYQVEKSQLKTVLIKAADISNLPSPEIAGIIQAYADNGWGSYAGNLTQYVVNADHESLFDESMLPELYKITQEILF